jgi:hypothetical protein
MDQQVFEGKGAKPDHQYACRTAKGNRQRTRASGMSFQKQRFRYDRLKDCWRWPSGKPLRFCEICSGAYIREGICDKCQDARRAEIARGKVTWMREKGRPGRFPLLSRGQIKCVDCVSSTTKRPDWAKPIDDTATEWDHRDWREPLKVVPVCRMHNSRRGRAMTAHEASFHKAVPA